MKYMLLLQASASSENGIAPSAADLDAMTGFDGQLIRAGVLLAGERLESGPTATRVEYSSEAPSVADGSFAQGQEPISGFWILQVASRDEAIEWARRVPLSSGRVEVRRVLEFDDFGPGSPDVRHEVAWHEHAGESRPA